MRLTTILFGGLLLVTCGSPGALSAASPSPIAVSASPSASPVASAPKTPTDLTLPQGCGYVGSGGVDLAVNTLATWTVDCGAAPDLRFIERMTPAFAQQGWSVCFIAGGRGVWAKGATQTALGQSAVGYPTLSQLPRQTQDCPLPTAYMNASYKYSLSLPAPYRNSTRLSIADTGGSPTAQDVFTARTDSDEATVSGATCETACAIWNYVAVVQIYMGTGSQTPRQFYSAFGGAVGETIEDTTVDGRVAVRVTNGVPYQFQYVVKDVDRIIRIGEQMYPADYMAVPVGASRIKLDEIVASFRFV